MTNTMYTPGNFQRQVYYQQAPGVEGDFCDHNVRTSVDAGPGGLVAHAEGVTIARFAWLEHSLLDPNNAPTIVRTRSTGGPVAGFIHREQQGLITHYLGGQGMVVPGGFAITVHDEGGFFVLNRGATYAQLGMKAFARGSDGGVLFGAAGSVPVGAAYTGSIVASVFDVAGSITGHVMTVESVASGVVTPGATIACVAFPPTLGVRVVSQIDGEPGGLGTYALSVPELTVPSGTAIQGTYGTMTVTAIDPASVAPINVGTMVTGTGVAVPTSVSAYITGAGGLGDYAVDNNTAVASVAMTGTDAVETRWYATSAGAPGELVKMTTWGR